MKNKIFKYKPHTKKEYIKIYIAEYLKIGLEIDNYYDRIKAEEKATTSYRMEILNLNEK